MLRLAADENPNNDILRGLLRRRPDLDIIRAQDVGLSGADDNKGFHLLIWPFSNARFYLDMSHFQPCGLGDG